MLQQWLASEAQPTMLDSNNSSDFKFTVFTISDFFVKNEINKAYQNKLKKYILLKIKTGDTENGRTGRIYLLQYM